MDIRQKIRNYKFDDGITPILQKQKLVNELNEILDNAKTKEERIEAATSIRSRVLLNPVSKALLMSGMPGRFV